MPTGANKGRGRHTYSDVDESMGAGGSLPSEKVATWTQLQPEDTGVSQFFTRY